MVRLIYERAANFDDLLQVVFSREELKFDPLVIKGFGPSTAPNATQAEADAIVNEIAGIEKLSGYSMCQDHTCVHERSIYAALLIYILQNRKKFKVEQANQLLAILNEKGRVPLELSTPSTFVKSLVTGTEGIPSPGYSKDQLKLLEKDIEMIIFVGICLANYLVLENLSIYLITSFALYLEAIRCDCKFLEDMKAWNLENRQLMATITKLENFLHGRNNAKGHSTKDHVKYVLFLNNFQKDLSAIKSSLKEYLSVEINHSTKTYFYESDFTELWRNLAYPFQSLLATITNSFSLQLSVLNELNKQNLEGEEKAAMDAKIASFQFEQPKTNNPYHIILASKDNMMNLINLLTNINSLSVYSIEKREQADLDNPNNKKKKISFKLGKGIEVFMESILHCLRQQENKEDEAAEGEKKDAVPADVKKDGSPKGEVSQMETAASTPKIVKFRPTTFKPLCMKGREIVMEQFESKAQERRRPKVPKGVRDTDPAQMRIKNIVFDMIRGIFNQHGAVEIDTPVFELKETLMGKYGEEGGKLIYDLNDQGGELLSLRYDLTVPFARYLATNNLKKIKRFHIGKVYRRDQPDMNRGRFREFYQCDLDVAGQYEGMIVDSEILTIIHEIMSKIDCGKHEIKLCHRVLLEGIVLLSGAPLAKFKGICSAIDKLDKEPWEAVAEELRNEKGIDPAAVEKIKTFVQHRGKIDDLLVKFEQSGLFANHPGSLKAIEELKLVSKYTKLLGSYDSITLDLSLARGLDYYTGLIYEVVIEGSKVGSVGAGGRYDNLAGMFGSTEIPCIGLSIGIERIFVLLEEKYKKAGRAIRENETQFLVATIGKDLAEHKIELISQLWKNGMKAEMLYEPAPKPQKQLTFALEGQIPYILWLGEDEIKNGIVKIKVNL